MQKFTIFTILFSLTVVAVISELLWNDYVKTPALVTTEQQAKLDLSLKDTITEINDNKQPLQDEKELTYTSKINEELLTKAGFIEVSIKKADFAGKLFQILPLAGIEENEVIKNNIFESNDFAAAIYEMPLNTEDTASELYNYLRDTAEKINPVNIKVNASNSYGISFYLNNDKKKNTVFLVVQIKNVVYAFEYPQKSHSKIKALLNLMMM